jgi:hypothetical protein
MHKKTFCMWGVLGTLLTVGMVFNSMTATRSAHVLVPTEQLVQKGQTGWMATAMAELEKQHHNGETMLAQVREEAAKDNGPSKDVKLALADGIAAKLEQLKTTEAGEKFLRQVNQEAKTKPQWVRMIAHQAARNMLLEIIHATKQQVLLDKEPSKHILEAKHDPWESKPSPELKVKKSSQSALSTVEQSHLEKLAGANNNHDDAAMVSAVTKDATHKMLPREVHKINQILAPSHTNHEELAAAAKVVNAKDETKVKLPMALKVVHKLTQLAATPEGTDYIHRVRSKLTGRETPEELDQITYNVAHTMLKQLVGNVEDDVLVNKQ